MSLNEVANTVAPKSALILMVKAPRAAQVKTRLCPPLSPHEAASLATAFLNDAVARARVCAPTVLIAYSPADGRKELEAQLSPGLLWSPQPEGDLGTRMAGALHAAALHGFSPLVIIGTDSPTLPPKYLSMAFGIVKTSLVDLVVGPTEDGGYYLIGLKRPVHGLFDGVAWSTERSLSDTLRNATELGLSIAKLPTWYEVDTPADLKRLQGELYSSWSARIYAARTWQWFNGHEDYDNRTDAE